MAPVLVVVAVAVMASVLVVAVVPVIGAVLVIASLLVIVAVLVVASVLVMTVVLVAGGSGVAVAAGAGAGVGWADWQAAMTRKIINGPIPQIDRFNKRFHVIVDELICFSPTFGC